MKHINEVWANANMKKHYAASRAKNNFSDFIGFRFLVSSCFQPENNFFKAKYLLQWWGSSSRVVKGAAKRREKKQK